MAYGSFYYPCENSMRKWSYQCLGSPFCWRRMFRPTGIIRQKRLYKSITKSDVETIKNLALQSVWSIGCPPPCLPLPDVRMRVEEGPSTKITRLAPSLVSFLEAAVANGCQGDGLKQKEFEVLETALKVLTSPENQFGLNLQVGDILDDLSRKGGLASTLTEETVNATIVKIIFQHLTKGCFVLNKRHSKVPNFPPRTYSPSRFRWGGLALGHRNAWFGEIDMLVCSPSTEYPYVAGHPDVAVFFDKPIREPDRDNQDDESGEEDDFNEGYYAPSIALEEKSIPETWSSSGSHFSQGFATAVTFSYVYHYALSKSQSVRPSLVPTIQISPSGFQIYFYDCVQDVMLANHFFWGRSSLICLWAFLHYRLFFPANLDQNLANSMDKFGYHGFRPGYGFYDNRADLLFGLSLNSPDFKFGEPKKGLMLWKDP